MFFFSLNVLTFKVGARKIMRGLISTLSTRFATSLFVPSQSTNGFSSLVSNQHVNKFNSALLQQCHKNFFKSVAKYCDESFLYPKIYPIVEKYTKVIKFTMKDGKRNTVKEVPERFFRLHWGGWIRTIAGRHRKVWRKNGKKKNRALQHVLCSSAQCKMLDTMVAKEWRVPRYYIEDPYAPYHKREGFAITRKKPWRPDGVDYE